MLTVPQDAVGERALLMPTAGNPDYFPLQPGNRWEYNGHTTTVTGRVTAPDGRHYFALDGYWQSVDPNRLVRTNRMHGVVEFNSDSPNPNLWYRLNAPVGTSWTIMSERPVPCLDGATLTIGSRTEVVTVPAGTFKDVVRIDIGNRCIDGGIIIEWFAPGVGLIKRANQSLIGVFFSELTRAEVGNLSLPAQSYGTTLSLNRLDYVNKLRPGTISNLVPVVRGNFKLVNHTETPLELDFEGCRRVSLVVRDDAGNELVRAQGDDGGCCATCTDVRHLSLADGVLKVRFKFFLRQPDGSPLPDGRYALVATLETLDPAPLHPSASVVVVVSSAY